jgi:HK97 family phage portal protein
MNSIFRSIRQRLANVLVGNERRSGYANPAEWLINWVNGGTDSMAGVKITEQSALKYSPFWAAIRIISGTCGSLPIVVYKKTERGRDRAPNHKAYSLLHDAPNEYMDAVTFIETRMAHVLTYGNGYAEIQRDGAGRPVALWPLLPDRTKRKLSPSGIPYYAIQPTHGDIVYLADDAVLHIKGLGYDGYTGYNVVQYHKDTLGYGIAVKEYGARYFANDASPGGVLEHPGTLGDKAAKHLTDSWNRQHQGLENKHRLAILEEGMTWKPIGVDPIKSQCLEVQKYSIDDCARIFQIPCHKLGSLEKASYNSIEEQNLDFITGTMFYWFRKIEQECNRKLFLPGERGHYYAEFLLDSLLRGNTASRYAAYAIGRQWGWLSIDDIREKENMNPIGAGGEDYLMPLNMVPAGTPPSAPTAAPAVGGTDSTAAGSSATPAESKATNVSPARRRAHQSLLTSQWARIVKQQVAAPIEAAASGAWVRRQEYAHMILLESACVYAAALGLSREDASASLDAVIVASIIPNATLSAECLAESTLQALERARMAQ